MNDLFLKYELSNLSVIFYYIITHPKTQWFKTTLLFHKIYLLAAFELDPGHIPDDVSWVYASSLSHLEA